MDRHITGLRIHDINQGLVAVSSGVINTHLRHTKRVGAAGQIAGLIAGEQVVKYESLLMAAGEMQIDDTLVDRSLTDLAELDWIRLVTQGSAIKRVEVKIPRLRDRYEELCRYWENLKPSELEQKTISVIDELALLPRHAQQLKNKHNLPPHELQMIRDVGQSAGFLDAYQSPTDGREILYSPLYWQENPTKLFELQKQFQEEEIAEAIRAVRSFQGLSCDDVSAPILDAAIRSGFLPTVAVVSTGGEKQFLFTPVEGLPKTQKLVYQKAMAILACVRYGQRYAQITRLRYPPEVTLNALLRRRQIGPHSEIAAQYSPLVKLRIGRLEKTGSRWVFHLIETEDNVAALNLAVKLATIGQGEAGEDQIRRASKLLLPQGDFKTPMKTRIDYKRTPRYSASSLDVIHSIIGGVSSDLL